MSSPFHHQGGHDGHIIDGAVFRKLIPNQEIFKIEQNFYEKTKGKEPWCNLTCQYLGYDADEQVLLIENICHGMEKPICADFKLGTQSWEPSQTESKIAKMKIRDTQSTTTTLGFRVTSCKNPFVDVPSGRVAVKRHPEVVEKCEWLGGRDEESVRKILLAFLPTEQLQKQFDEKIEKFLRAFQKPLDFHFVGMSLYVVYDDKNRQNMKLKILDFAHAIEQTPKSVDVFGVYEGLKNLKQIVRNCDEMSNLDEILLDVKQFKNIE